MVEVSVLGGVVISPDYCVTLARHARWQHRQLIVALSGLEAGQRRKLAQQGPEALMALCARQLQHDHLWLGRLEGSQRVALDGGYAEDFVESWDMWRRDRQETDARLLEWARGLDTGALEGELFWFAPQERRAVSRPCWLCATHLFTVQTDLRGRIAAELRHLGARLPAADLISLPQDIDWL